MVEKGMFPLLGTQIEMERIGRALNSSMGTLV